jgi:hypothetical protein
MLIWFQQKDDLIVPNWLSTGRSDGIATKSQAISNYSRYSDSVDPGVIRGFYVGANTMKSIEQIIALTGIDAILDRVIKLDDTNSIPVLKVKKGDALAAAAKLSAISEETGYSPLFPYKGKVDEITGQLATENAMWTKQAEYNASHQSIKSNPFAVRITRGVRAAEARLNQSRQDATLQSAEAIDVETWLKAEDDLNREVGNFTKHRFQMPEIPFCESIMLVPVAHCWQIPAVISFGGWDSCPEDQIHIALMKRWYTQYGARLICMGKDSMFFQVERPVRDRDEALSLAREQFSYCPDNVLQGFGNGTLSGAAVDLLDATVWQFWWD